VRIFWSIKKRIYRLLGKRFSIVIRDGKFLLLDNLNWIDTRLLIKQPYEKLQIQRAYHLAQKNECDLFLDIGANIGLYTIKIGSLPGIDVHAFEPVLRNFYQLNANLMLNNLEYKVTSHKVALSDEDDEVVIFVDPNSTGISRIDLGDRSESCFTSKEKIQTTKLDSMYHWKNKKIFIKIDVEGHELNVLNGMQKILKSNQCIVLIEAFEGDAAVLLQLKMKEMGFDQHHNEGDYLFSNYKFIP
jgi:FkbM family methyltransferase